MGQKLTQGGGYLSRMTQPLSYLSSTYFFRLELRRASTKADAIELGMHVCDEHERLRDWCRERGLVPPKWFVTPSERAARAAGAVVPFPRKDPASATE